MAYSTKTDRSIRSAGPFRASSLGLACAVALLLAGPIRAQDKPNAFIEASKLPDIRTVISPPPSPGSLDQADDEVIFLDSRPQLASPRGQEAADDDVYTPAAVAPRFADALGVTLTPANAPVTLALIGRVVMDVENFVAPIKQAAPPAGTGRVRPFVQYPKEDHCPLTKSDTDFDLAGTGSYPSTHAMIGWIWASILTADAPDRANQLFGRGIGFGESRIICGFHYNSDVVAGRVAAAALLARLQGEPAFVQALAQSKLEIAAVRASQAAAPAGTTKAAKPPGASPQPAPPAQ